VAASTGQEAQHNPQDAGIL
jgi:hypothetical protein